MTVQELIDELESFDGEAEVRFLAQPCGLLPPLPDLAPATDQAERDRKQHDDCDDDDDDPRCAHAPSLAGSGRGETCLYA